MKHFSEEELIAYQLHESSDEEPISQHLESCSECADLSESIPETLRVFPPILFHSLTWSTVGNVFAAILRRHRNVLAASNFCDGVGWPAAGLATAALIFTAFGLHHHTGGKGLPLPSMVTRP
jgi:hypothetical protein